MGALYKPYPDYKKSGVEWLGDVPITWRVSRLAFVFTKANAGEVIDKTYWGEGEELLYTCNRTPLKSDYPGFPEVKRTEPNDLLLTRNGTPYVHKPIPGSIYSNVVQRITLKNGFDRNYLMYCLGNSAKNLKGYGVSIESLNFENWKSLSFSYPNKNVQIKLVNYLDHETAKIDTLVEKQQQLIKLLKEKRQAMISHAVTKGLNPKAPMCYSGIEWLGEVPEEWKVVPLKYLVINESGIQMGPFGGMLKDLEYSDTGYKLYGQENTISGDFTKGGRWLTLDRFQELSNYKLKDGDIVLTRKGSLGKARQIHKLETPGIIDSDTIRVRVDSSLITTDFLSILMHEAHYINEQIIKTRRGSVLPGLNTATISNLKVLLPLNTDYQDKLVVEVKRIIDFFDHTLDKCIEKCELLIERRTALISAVVTGKIDVRNWIRPTLSSATASTLPSNNGATND